MISTTKIIRHWGKSNFTRFTPKDLLGMKIPPSSKQFLIDVGLPRKLGPGPKGELGISIDASQGRLPTLAEFLAAQDENYRSDLELTKYRRFGSSFEAHLCINEGQKGCVVRIDWDIGGPLVQFVNSRIEQFVACLFLVEKATGGCIGLTQEEQKQFVKDEERMFRQVDRKALEHWWGAILTEWKAAVG